MTARTARTARTASETAPPAAPGNGEGFEDGEGGGREPLPPEQFAAVVNDEGQYSLWPVWQPLPGGWHDTGVHGSREKCLAHIEAVWTDMRPRSLRTSREPDA